MKEIQGDLIALAKEGRFDVIAHGCNCFCGMGAGLALAISREFPEAAEADKQTCSADPDKLGTCSVATCTRNGYTFDVVNAYTQFHWAGAGVLVNYGALYSCMQWIKSRYAGKRIGLPKIGAGLARGDWNVIKNIIAEVLEGEGVTIVLYEEQNS